MKTLRKLAQEATQLAKYAKTGLPRDVGREWLRASQNAFFNETDPSTGQRWPDRHGLIRDSTGQRFGNIEQYLSYSKLHRTGKLFRGLKFGYGSRGDKSSVVNLYNRVPYASEHEEGERSGPKRIPNRYTTGGVKSITTGTAPNVSKRSFMKPGNKIFGAPRRLLAAKMRSFGW